MSETSTLIGYGGRTIGREELALVPTPVATGNTPPGPAPRDRATVKELEPPAEAYCAQEDEEAEWQQFGYAPQIRQPRAAADSDVVRHGRDENQDS